MTLRRVALLAAVAVAVVSSSASDVPAALRGASDPSAVDDAEGRSLQGGGGGGGRGRAGGKKKAANRAGLAGTRKKKAGGQGGQGGKKNGAGRKRAGGVGAGAGGAGNGGRKKAADKVNAGGAAGGQKRKKNRNGVGGGSGGGLSAPMGGVDGPQGLMGAPANPYAGQYVAQGAGNTMTAEQEAELIANRNGGGGGGSPSGGGPGGPMGASANPTAGQNVGQEAELIAPLLCSSLTVSEPIGPDFCNNAGRRCDHDGFPEGCPFGDICSTYTECIPHMKSISGPAMSMGVPGMSMGAPGSAEEEEVDPRTERCVPPDWGALGSAMTVCVTSAKCRPSDDPDGRCDEGLTCESIWKCKDYDGTTAAGMGSGNGFGGVPSGKPQGPQMNSGAPGGMPGGGPGVGGGGGQGGPGVSGGPNGPPAARVGIAPRPLPEMIYHGAFRCVNPEETYEDLDDGRDGRCALESCSNVGHSGDTECYELTGIWDIECQEMPDDMC